MSSKYLEIIIRRCNEWVCSRSLIPGKCGLCCILHVYHCWKQRGTCILFNAFDKQEVILFISACSDVSEYFGGQRGCWWSAMALSIFVFLRMHRRHGKHFNRTYQNKNTSNSFLSIQKYTQLLFYITILSLNNIDRSRIPESRWSGKNSNFGIYIVITKENNEMDEYTSSVWKPKPFLFLCILILVNLAQYELSNVCNPNNDDNDDDDDDFQLNFVLLILNFTWYKCICNSTEWYAFGEKLRGR